MTGLSWKKLSAALDVAISEEPEGDILYEEDKMGKL